MTHSANADRLEWAQLLPVQNQRSSPASKGDGYRVSRDQHFGLFMVISSERTGSDELWRRD